MMSTSRRYSIALLAGLILGGCVSTPLAPYTSDTPPLVMVPADRAGVVDKQARFREIFCAVLDAHGRELPDYRPCDEALTRVGSEPPGTGPMIFYDQVIPGGALIGYLNADHWAIAVPIARRGHRFASLFVDQNAYPREALAEAVLRFVEEDLAAQSR